MGAGAASASWDALRAEGATHAEISARNRARFAAAIAHARATSPLYRELYADVPDGASDPELLPPTDKELLVERFDEWVTNPRARLAEVGELIEDPDRIGERYLGRYVAARSTGTTGLIGIVLKDPPEVAVQNALRLRGLLRWLAPGDLARLALRRGRAAAVTSTGRHYIGLASIRAQAVGRRAVRIVSSQQPMAEIVRELNEERPAIVNGYASMISMLASEQEAGRLRISPVLVTSSSETLTESERRRIERAFGSKLGETYATSECPFIAHSCAHGWLHLNEDWALLEPVDAEDRPVPPGEESAGVLVSNLANRVQPILRYRVSDEIVLRREQCPCGSPFRAVRLLGRRPDSIRVAGERGEVEITGSVLGTAVGLVGGITAFQLEQTGPAALRLRLRFGADPDPELAWRVSEAALRELLANKGAANVRVERAQEDPLPGPGGKYPKVLAQGAPARRDDPSTDVEVLR